MNNELRNNLDAKISYLQDIHKSYVALNKSTKNVYGYRIHAIEMQIDALEELRDNIIEGTWNICYEEDLQEVRKSFK
jgi:hypothetical protein